MKCRKSASVNADFLFMPLNYGTKITARRTTVRGREGLRFRRKLIFVRLARFFLRPQVNWDLMSFFHSVVFVKNDQSDDQYKRKYSGGKEARLKIAAENIRNAAYHCRAYGSAKISCQG